MDTQSMVAALMEVERVPRYQLESEINAHEAEESAWNQIDSSVSLLRTKTEALTSYLTWQQMSAEAGDSTVLSATVEHTACCGVYDVTVTNLAEAYRMGSDAQADAASPLGHTGDFTIEGVQISVASTDSLTDIRDSINTAALSMDEADRVRATIIDTTMVIERVETGDDTIAVSDGTGDILESLGLLDSGKSVKNLLQQGEDLALSLNGVAVTRSSNAGLTDIVAGVTLNILDEGDSLLTVARDTAAIRTAIEEFVSAYNDAMTAAEAASAVGVYEAETVGDEAGTPPETGVLQGDWLIRQIQLKAREMATATEQNPDLLDPDFNSLRTIGVWTEGRDNRLAVTDSDALDDALANHIDEVEDLFRDYDAGIARALDEYLYALTRPGDGRITNRLSTISDSIDDKLDRIEGIDRRLQTYEESLWLQFALMEDAMAQMQQQLNFIQSLLPANGFDSS
jgi:flagellar hook-associated protein 2